MNYLDDCSIVALSSFINTNLVLLCFFSAFKVKLLFFFDSISLESSFPCVFNFPSSVEKSEREE